MGIFSKDCKPTEYCAPLLKTPGEVKVQKYKEVRVARHKVFWRWHWAWYSAQRILETHRSYGFIKWHTTYPLKRVPLA